jgi:serine/threonine-protein kinase
MVGAVLDGRYRIRGRIARGGMATVYDAVDERLERTVAVKVMHPSYASDPSFIDRFIREAKATAGLNHPNVVAVFDQGSHDGLAFLVMEQIAGHTLRDVLAERGRLSIAEAMSILDSVLDALAAAHRSGLVHRDVKPENVLIGTDGVVKVADFGLARAVESSTRTATGGVVMGTVAYVSPEQIITGHADPRSDVYSAGVMLFEMLAGAVPFGGDSAVNIAFQHVNRDVPAMSEWLAEVPPALDELVLRATRREPGVRPADAGAFLAELRYVSEQLRLPHVTVAAPPPAPAPPPAVFAATRAVPHPMLSPDRLDEAPMPDPPGPRRRLRPGLIATTILLALGLLAATTGWWLGAGRYTEAPSVLNLTKAEAEAKVREIGLGVRYGKAQNSDTVAAGRVLSQDPRPNGRVLDGGAVTVVLSLGPLRPKVPQVANLAADEAKRTLANRNIKFTEKAAFSDSISEGFAIGTNPPAGTELEKDAVVTLLISNGSRPIELPDLRGRTQQDAEKIVRDLGLKTDVEEKDVDDESFQGRVVEQDPGPGNVTAGSTVRLIVGKGQAQGEGQVSVPDLRDKSFREAQRELRDLGLNIRRLNRGSKVIIQFPGPGSQVDPDTTITVVLGN